MINTDTSQNYLPAKFHNFKISGLFFIHKNITVQFFMKHRVYIHMQPSSHSFTAAASTNDS